MPFPSSWRLLSTAVIVAFGSSFHSGYFMLVYNIPQDVMEEFVNESSIRLWNQSLSRMDLMTSWSSVAGLDQVGRFVSCFIAPISADRLGRKNTLLIWSAPAAIGFLFQYLSYPTKCYPLLAVGRLISGVYNGLVGIVVPLFLVEIAISSQWRGAVTRIHNVVNVIGSLTALVLGLPDLFGSPSLWSFLPLIPMPLLFLEVLWLTNVPESPLHLIHNQYPLEVIDRSFQFYLGPTDRQIIDSSSFQRVMAARAKPHQRKSYVRLMRKRGRKLLILWILLATAASLAGGSLTNNYSTAILAGFQSLSNLAKYSSIIINVFKFLSVLLALYTIDRIGRRVMLLFCSWIVVLCYVLLIAVAVFAPFKNASIFVRIWFVLVWTSSQYIVNSTSVLIVSESCQQDVRAFSLALFKVVFHVISVLVTVTFPALASISEIWSYSVLVVPYVCTVVYLTAVCPETGHVSMLSMEVDEDDRSEQTPLVNTIDGTYLDEQESVDLRGTDNGK